VLQVGLVLGFAEGDAAQSAAEIAADGVFEVLLCQARIVDGLFGRCYR